MLALGAIFAGKEAAEYVANLIKTNEWFGYTATSGAQLNTALTQVSETFEQLSARTGVEVTSQEQLNRAVNEGLLYWDKATQTYQRTEEQLIQMGKATDTAAKFSGDLTDATKTTSTAVTTLRGVSSSATSDIQRLGVGMSSTAEDADKVAGELNKVSYEANKLPEQIKLKLDATSIQANTQIATESLQSLSTTIESTGALLDTLFGLLIQNPDSPFVDKILEQIETENKLREEAFELQKSMIESYVKWLDARTEALQRDEALIQIDGGNLQPHLEAFMWEILSAIQVRVNEEGLELLLGL
jgi:hypothetical protein